MEQFLINNRLQDYCDIFQKEGYDDLEFLQTLTEEELKKEFIIDMGMKKGHYAKLFKGIKNEKAKKTDEVENNISMDIPENIKYKFGKAPIRFKQNDKYYHGLNAIQSAQLDKTGNRKSDYIGCMWHYTNQNVNFPNPDWDTHEIEGFCFDCSYCSDKNKKKRKIFIYKCNGHELDF